MHLRRHHGVAERDVLVPLRTRFILSVQLHVVLGERLPQLPVLLFQAAYGGQVALLQ